MKLFSLLMFASLLIGFVVCLYVAITMGSCLMETVLACIFSCVAFGAVGTAGFLYLRD